MTWFIVFEGKNQNIFILFKPDHENRALYTPKLPKTKVFHFFSMFTTFRKLNLFNMFKNQTII